MGQDRSTTTPEQPPDLATPLPPGAARRRELRQQRRAERWRNLWRLLVFSGISAGLATVLLRQGWMLRDPSQVQVSGSRIVSRDQVLQAGQGFMRELGRAHESDVIFSHGDHVPLAVRNAAVVAFWLPDFFGIY